MIVDLTEYQEKGSYTTITGEYLPEDIDYFQREIIINEPFYVELTVFSDVDEFVFTGKMEGEYILACTRCLDKFSYPVEKEFEFIIAKEDIDDIAHVDLKKELRANIIMTIPSKALCSPDCKGICSQCGQNLNISTCDCEQEQGDPRMNKLKDFFDQE
ncbi:MAG: YceD family protein [Bacillota bacterium]